MRVDAHGPVAGTVPSSSTWASHLLGRVSRYFYGDDVFISYSRADGVVYAQGLAAELTGSGFTCRIDLYDTDTSADIPLRLRNVIRRAYLLLVVGSPAACQSKYVKLEIEEFGATGRNFVVVGFGSGIANACWFGAVAGRVVQERPRALITGQPSRAIISLAEDSFHFQKRNRRLRRTAFITGLSIGVMLLIGVAGGLILRSDIATKQAELATSQDALTQVEGRLGRAQQELTGARVLLDTARGQLGRTEELRARAAAEAITQETIARARKDAADAVGIRNQRGYMPVADALTAVRAARSLTTLGLPGEADAALRSVRTTLSALVADPPSHADPPPEPVDGVIESPDGSLFAGHTKTGESTVVWKKGAAEVLYRFRCGEPIGYVHLAFSSDARHLAQSCAGRFAVFNLETGTRRNGFSVGWTSQVAFGPSHLFVVAQGDVESLVVFDLASGAEVSIGFQERAPLRLVLSPDGRFLATSCRWYGGERPVNCAVRVYELPKFVQTISQRESDESRHVFSNDGAYLAVRVAGVMRIWETATQLLLATFPLPNEANFRFGRNPSRLYVTSTTDARVLDTFSGEVLAVFPGGLRLNDDRRVPGAVSVTGREFAETWRVQPLDKTGFLETRGQAHRLQFDGSGRYFSLCTAEGQEPDWRVSLWDINSSQRLMEESAEECAVAFETWRTSVPGAGAATTSRRTTPSVVRDERSRTLRLKDALTGKTVFASEFRSLYSAWSEDATVVVGANAQELRIWRVADAKLLLTRPVPPDVNRFAFSPDNRYLLMSWGRGRTRLGLYSWRLEDMLAETCDVLRSSLRSRFVGMRPDRVLLARACPN